MNRHSIAVGALVGLALTLAACGSSSPAQSASASASSLASSSAAAEAVASSAASPGSAAPSASAAAAGNGQLGMIFEVNNKGWQKLLNTPDKKGMVVVLVLPNQPGAKAGIAEGDLITKMNGVDTTNANIANLQIRKLKVGDKVSLDLERKSGPAKVDVTVDPAQQLDLPAVLDDRVNKAPNDARFLFLRAAYGKKDAKSMMDDYNKAIQTAPDFVSAYVERGTAEQTANQDAALQDFNKAASLDPNYEPLYVNRSVLYSARKEYDKALADDQKAVQLDPSDPAAYANLGIGLVNSGDPTKALAAENDALQRDPQFGPALLYRGLLMRDAAKADLQNASRLVRDPQLKSVADNALQKMS
ncbi:MAG TPA: PDZ domain-containing protein [Chloroflexota bacterium]|nr:PDZ domain-containing protein [Chloroflexota bacterium]